MYKTTVSENNIDEPEQSATAMVRDNNKNTVEIRVS